MSDEGAFLQNVLSLIRPKAGALAAGQDESSYIIGHLREF